ncbi:hypothetical protein F2P81_016111 [Scophthalmus maximus]|uniref:Uncharacterized protein n=1 Tax=Scophthalmus maximus TaxID=52904 RepID=A0A6A4S8L2_SCOMX|nr:hypothetical protein F2P81_016111 [Scophthalmus maximus]
MDRVPPCRVKHVFNNGTVTIRQLSWMKFATSEINTFLAHCVMSRQLRGTVLLVKRTQTLVIFCRRGQSFPPLKDMDVTGAASGSSDIGHRRGELTLFPEPRETQGAIWASHSRHAIRQHSPELGFPPYPLLFVHLSIQSKER